MIAIITDARGPCAGYDCDMLILCQGPAQTAFKIWLVKAIAWLPAIFGNSTWPRPVPALRRGRDSRRQQAPGHELADGNNAGQALSGLRDWLPACPHRTPANRSGRARTEARLADAGQQGV